MNTIHLVRQSIFIIRFHYLKKMINYFYEILLRFAGLKIGKRTFLPINTKITWPHQVKLGNNCQLEYGIYFHYDGIYSDGPSICIGDNVFIGNNTEFNITDNITIGENCLIASGCKFVDHSHGFKFGKLIKTQKSSKQAITIGSDVWLGCNVVVLKGVTIGNGVVVGAGAVVTKSIPENEIWGGVPAKKMADRKL